ncbi:MAG: HEAT repeat domain-containing protein, partial [Deltaproteobacteria bacterium]|nr:HEAT repeat domain-containing protein [Deltaproteobacteria bacterium]
MRKRCIRSCMILLLVLFSFSGVYAQYAPPVSSFHAALVLEDERLTRDKNYFLIWKMYARALSHPEYKLDENVAEVLPGQYENARTAILKRMRELAGQEEVSSRVTPEAEAFLKEVQQGTIGNEAALERGRPYLPLAEGFPIFDLLGDRYLESGGCEKAVSVWEEAKEISLGYGAFTPKKKISYLTKLGHCYKELGWKDKLESLFSEFPNLTQEEGQEVLENWDSVQKALEGLHRYVQDCPPQVPSSLASVPAESEESFFIRKESFLEPDGEFYDQEQLCFDENPKWCFETTKLFFVSKPFIYRGRVYSVVKEKGGALYLQVLDRKTGQLLTQRYLGYHPKIVSRRGSLYPYSLNLKEGKIHLDTEVFHGEFTIDGTISSLIHLTEPQLPQALKEQYRFSRDIENGGPKLLVFLLAQDAESLRVLKGADLEIPYLIEAYREAGKGDSLIEWMAQMGSTAVIPLVTAVQNNPLERGMAVKVLEKMKEDPMPQLLSLLNSDNPKLIKKVARILGEWALEDLRGISALIERYETEENSVVRLALVGTLANSKDYKDIIQKKELAHLGHQEDLL